MDWLDRTFYAIKARFPWLYDMAAWGGRQAVVLLFGRAIRQAQAQSAVDGTVRGKPATMRHLHPTDVGALAAMLEEIPEDHLRFFHPHGLGRSELDQVVRRPDIMTYGLFANGKICAYAILKLFPTRKAYIGRLVSPALAGLGIGRFLSRYLYWQSRLLGFQPCSTIHTENLASLKSHAAVRPYEVAADLPNGFKLIRFTTGSADDIPPELCIRERGRARNEQGSEKPRPHAVNGIP